MSAEAFAAAAAAPPPPPFTSSFFLQILGNLGLAYSIAIALCVLVLLSSLLFASYVCCRSPRPYRNPNPNPSVSGGSTSNGIVLPSVIFIAEEDEDDDLGRGDARRIGGVLGLDPAAISSYPKFPCSAASKEDDNVCSICLCEYREGEMLRMIPDCKHYFHLLCIDAWLKLNASCPVCRTSPMPTPLSTPLSELVPLSQFSADWRRR